MIETIKDFISFYKENKRWAYKDNHNKLYYLFLPIKLFWDFLWENTLGPLWRLKWWIIDDIFHSKMKRKLIISTLDRTWTDKDEVMLHACFQLLVDFIEKERAREVVDFWSEFEGNADFHVFDELYFWWTKIRPNRVDPFDSKWFEGVSCPSFEEDWVPDEKRKVVKFQPNTIKYKEYWDLLKLAGEIETRYILEDQEKLELLIKHRRGMWC